MSPWPGAPKSQQTPPINPPSMRKFPSLNENSTMSDVASAVQVAFNGILDHEQAFANLPAQIKSQASATATNVYQNVQQENITGVTSFNTQTGAVIYFPNLGRVNDQMGSSLYLTQSSDAGQMIVLGDSGAVSLSLNGSMAPPWFAMIENDSTSMVRLSSNDGSPVDGLQAIYPGGSAMVFYDGSIFWCAGAAIATDSSLGVVQPDGITIDIDSSGILSVPIAADSSLGLVRPDGVTIVVDSGFLSTQGATGQIILAPTTDSGATGQINVSNGLIVSFINPT